MSNEPIKKCEEFKIMWRYVNEKNYYTNEITNRIDEARSTSINMKRIFIFIENAATKTGISTMDLLGKYWKYPASIKSQR